MDSQIEKIHGGLILSMVTAVRLHTERSQNTHNTSMVGEDNWICRNCKINLFDHGENNKYIQYIGDWKLFMDILLKMEKNKLVACGFDE